MRKISNIRLKDEPNARLLAMRRFKEHFNVGLKEAMAKVDELLSKGEMIAPDEKTDSLWGREYNLMTGYSIYHIAESFNMVFDYDYETDEQISNENILEPSEETKEALAWFEGLSAEDKARVDSIVAWRVLPLCPVC